MVIEEQQRQAPVGIVRFCGAPVHARCGDLVVWHWAHNAEAGCDPWSEPEAPWHLWWKERVPLEQREVTIGSHLADIVVEKGVIELQHSSISTQEIIER